MIKDLIPDAFIGVDVIAGARGETEEELRRSMDFIEGLPVTRLHVFPYSERPGTAALLMNAPLAEISERHRRAALIQQISDAKLSDFFRRMEGSERPVLWEHMVHDEEDNAPAEPLMSGLTDNYLRIVAPARPELLNAVCRVRIGRQHPTLEETLMGEHI